MRRTRILVADPLHIFRVGVRNLPARESDFEVTAVQRTLFACEEAVQ